eukprot:795123-Amphidinium_carterae.1
MATAEQLQSLSQEMQRMNARLQAAKQAGADVEARVQQAERGPSGSGRKAEKEQVAAVGHPTKLVDTRSFGRPRELKSVREGWKNWSFQFKAFLSGANPALPGLNDQPITMANLP